MNEYLVKVLKEARINKGLKQSDVAKIVGVKANTLSNYENGVSEPDIDTFANLCEIYELDFAYVLGEAYGMGIIGADFDIKPSEIEIIKKYRDLDENGKKIVDDALENTYSLQKSSYIKGQQSIWDIIDEETKHKLLEETKNYNDSAPYDFLEHSINSNATHSTFSFDISDNFYNEPVAAHNSHADEQGELEKMQEDISSLKRPE